MNHVQQLFATRTYWKNLFVCLAYFVCPFLTSSSHCATVFPEAFAQKWTPRNWLWSNSLVFGWPHFWQLLFRGLSFFFRCHTLWSGCCGCLCCLPSPPSCGPRHPLIVGCGNRCSSNCRCSKGCRCSSRCMSVCCSRCRCSSGCGYKRVCCSRCCSRCGCSSRC